MTSWLTLKVIGQSSRSSGQKTRFLGLEKNHISKSIVPRVMKFGRGIDLDDLMVYLEGQGHRSKAKVSRSKNVIFGHFT